jgi:uncharacterized membrane protein
MIQAIILTFLWSLSPLGEGRVGIPYGISEDLPLWIAFIVGLAGNLLIFPIFFKLIELTNKIFWKKSRTYKKGALYFAKRAKRGAGKQIEKYGVWGLMVFVMIPLPVTGAYVGTIAAYMMQMSFKKSLFAISLGVFIALSIIAGGSQIVLLLSS